MSRKRKELPTLPEVKIIDVGAEGNAVARVDDMVVFVPFAAPGDIADIKITKKKRSYAEGKIERMVSPSDIRVEPRCEHFTVCGVKSAVVDFGPGDGSMVRSFKGLDLTPSSPHPGT